MIRRAPVRPVVNVTPLVDVVLVLLIVFMVVAPLLERELAVHLPATASAAVPDPGQILLSVRRGGEVQIDGQPVRLRDLDERLTSLLSARPDAVVFFQADDAVRYGDAVAILDAARGAGATEIATVIGSGRP